MQKYSNQQLGRLFDKFVIVEEHGEIDQADKYLIFNVHAVYWSNVPLKTG